MRIPPPLVAPAPSRGRNSEYIYLPPAGGGPLGLATYRHAVAPQLSLIDQGAPLPLPPPTLRRRPVPKTLYDLFAVHGVASYRVPILPALSFTAAQANRPRRKQTLSATTASLVRSHAKSSATQEADWAINAHIVALAGEDDLFDAATGARWVERLLHDLTALAQWPEPAAPDVCATLTTPRAQAFIAAAVREEVRAPEGTTYYRAGYVQTDRQFGRRRATSTSFGSTPLMGICYDGINGCVTAPHYQPRAMYSVAVDADSAALFYAPNMRRSQRIFSQGELLHPRTKSTQPLRPQAAHFPGLKNEPVHHRHMAELFLPPGAPAALCVAQNRRLVDADAQQFIYGVRAVMALASAHWLFSDLRIAPVLFVLATPLTGPLFLDCLVYLTCLIPRDVDASDPFLSEPSWLPEAPYTH